MHPNIMKHKNKIYLLPPRQKVEGHSVMRLNHDILQTIGFREVDFMKPDLKCDLDLQTERSRSLNKSI